MKKIIYLFFLLLFFTISKVSLAQTQETKSKNVLEINRVKIDSLDFKIIEAIGLREKLVREIGEYKAVNHIPPLQPARFQEIIKKSIVFGKKQELSELFIRQLMNSIHEESLRIEVDIKNKNATGSSSLR